MELPESGPGSLAGVGARALARVSDFFVSIAFPNVVLLSLFAETIETEENGTEVVGLPFWVPLLAVAVLAAMEIGVPAWKGRTLGMLTGRLSLRPLHRADHVAIANASTDEPVSEADGLVDPLAIDGDQAQAISTRVAVRRGLPGVLVYAGAWLAPVGVGELFLLGYIVLYLSPLLDPLYKQGWHDKLAGTVVVRA